MNRHLQAAVLLAVRLFHAPWLLHGALLDLGALAAVGERWHALGLPGGIVLAALSAGVRLATGALLLLGFRLERLAWIGLGAGILELALFTPDAWRDSRPWAVEPLVESAAWTPLVALAVVAAFGAGPWSLDGLLARRSASTSGGRS